MKHTFHDLQSLGVVCVCVCMMERDRERDVATGRKGK